jgi:hypothetical protein
VASSRSWAKRRRWQQHNIGGGICGSNSRKRARRRLLLETAYFDLLRKLKKLWEGMSIGWVTILDLSTRSSMKLWYQQQMAGGGSKEVWQVRWLQKQGKMQARQQWLAGEGGDDWPVVAAGSGLGSGWQ